MRKNKLNYILLSLVISFSLWLYVVNNVSQEDTTTISGIPVNITGETVLNEQNWMITGISSQTMAVKLTGARSELAKVNASNILAKVDVSQINKVGDRIPLYPKLTYPGEVASNAFVEESKNPGVIYVSVDYRREKPVPVKIKWTGTRSADFLYDTENIVLDYASVTVVGPAAVADQIEQAIIEVDLSQRQKSISESFRYTLCNADGEPVDAEQIMTNVEEIHLDMQIHRIKELKLVADIIPGGGATEDNVSVTMTLDTIRVSGGDAVLEEMGDTYTVCTVNLAEIERNIEQTFPINLPEGVTNQTGVNEVTVNVKLSGLRSKEFVVESIQSINVPEGLEAEIINASLTVKVRGPKEEIDKLTEKNIFATVDFTGAEVGSATYKAVITFSDEFKSVGALKTNPVSATVRAKGE